MRTADERWTPRRRETLRDLIEMCRAFVRCADEFVTEDGARFYPDALTERWEALDAAHERNAKAWEELPPLAAALSVKITEAAMRGEVVSVVACSRCMFAGCEACGFTGEAPTPPGRPPAPPQAPQAPPDAGTGPQGAGTPARGLPVAAAGVRS